MSYTKVYPLWFQLVVNWEYIFVYSKLLFKKNGQELLTIPAALFVSQYENHAGRFIDLTSHDLIIVTFQLVNYQ